MKTNLVLVGLLLFALSGPAQTNPIVAPTNTARARPQLPAKFKAITTREGKTYRNVTIEKADPAGLTVSYPLGGRGLGVIKIPFAQLPDSIQAEYGYDPKAAAEFQASQRQATAGLAAQMSADEKAWKQMRAEKELREAEAAEKAQKAADEERKIRAAEAMAVAAAVEALKPPPEPPVVIINNPPQQ